MFKFQWSFFKVLTSVLSLSLLFGVCGATKKIATKRPNIIFIMSDDHTSQAIGVYGGRLARLNPTPNLDKLAKEGMVFENAFCTNSICTPSRANVLTGQYSQTNGVLDLDGALPPERQYLPQEMKKRGYSTAIIGKWHLHDEPLAFDYYKVLPGQGTYFNPKFREKGIGEWPDNIVQYQGHSTDVITDQTIEYLKYVDKSKPFFLMHHYKAPHDMFKFAPRYRDYLKDVEIPEPASMYEEPYWGSEGTRGANDSLIHYIGTSISERNTYRNYVQYYLNDSIHGGEATHLAYQHYLKDYLRCVKGVDDNLKRLFDFLKREGLWDNTVIIYSGDQGMMLGEHDLQDKRWMYDQAMRMPFIVHYPDKIKAGVRSDLLINNTDYAPTIIGLAGGKTPAYMQGKSFVNTLMGEPENNWREVTYYRYWMHIIHHYVPAHFGIRSKDYKLIFFYGKHYLSPDKFMNFYWATQYVGIDRTTPPAWEFYDLKNDSEELHNRYNDPAYKNIICDLKKKLKDQRKMLNETDHKYPEIQKIVDDNWDK